MEYTGQEGRPQYTVDKDLVERQRREPLSGFISQKLSDFLQRQWFDDVMNLEWVQNEDYDLDGRALGRLPSRRVVVRLGS